MTLVFKKGMEASIGGMKAVQYEVSNTLATHAATIDAQDIGLSTIMWLTANQVVESAAVSIAYGVALGTFLDGIANSNYATVFAHTIGSTTRVDAGTFQIFAIGM